MEFAVNRTGIEEKFFNLCTKVCRENGYVLYDLEYIIGPKLLRVYIMNESTKSALIEDCIKVDNALTPYFETETWMPLEITLEVSSPGIFRQLKTLEHFTQVKSHPISIVLNKNLAEMGIKEFPKSIISQKKLMGKLKEIESDKILLEIESFNIPIIFTNIKRANLEMDGDLKN